jgi:hypothetical protein
MKKDQASKDKALDIDISLDEIATRIRNESELEASIDILLSICNELDFDVEANEVMSRELTIFELARKAGGAGYPPDVRVESTTYSISSTLESAVIEAFLNMDRNKKTLANKPLHVKSENAYLRTIEALSDALCDGFTGKVSKDAGAVLMVLSSKGIESPIGQEALAKYLKKAKEL